MRNVIFTYNNLLTNKTLADINNKIGFQKNKSYTKAVFDLYTRVADALNKGNYVYNVFLDFAKAFDTITHKILLSKLQYYGIKGIAKNWVESYLINRKQVVEIDNILSGEKNI